MKNGVWHGSIAEDDSLEIMPVEVEELENDELSVGEAGFLQGYEDDIYDPYEEV